MATYNTKELIDKYGLNKEDFDVFVMAYANDFRDIGAGYIEFEHDNIEELLQAFGNYGFSINEEGGSILDTDPEALRKSATGFESLADELEDIQNMTSSLNENFHNPELLKIFEAKKEDLEVRMDMLRTEIKESIMDVFKGKNFLTEASQNEYMELKNMLETNIIPKLKKFGLDVTEWRAYQEAMDYEAKGDILNADRILMRVMTDAMTHLHGFKGQLHRESRNIKITKGKLQEIVNKQLKKKV